MVTFDVSYDLNWGKSYKKNKNRLYNKDNIDGIVNKV